MNLIYLIDKNACFKAFLSINDLVFNNLFQFLFLKR